MTCVPHGGVVSIVKLPPKAIARERMVVMPWPPAKCTAVAAFLSTRIPRPSSLICTTTSFASVVSKVTEIDDARACLMALVTASRETCTTCVATVAFSTRDCPMCRTSRSRGVPAVSRERRARTACTISPVLIFDDFKLQIEFRRSTTASVMRSLARARFSSDRFGLAFTLAAAASTCNLDRATSASPRACSPA